MLLYLVSVLLRHCAPSPCHGVHLQLTAIHVLSVVGLDTRARKRDSRTQQTAFTRKLIFVGLLHGGVCFSFLRVSRLFGNLSNPQSAPLSVGVIRAIRTVGL